jgi:hypothetical protein
MGEDRRVRHAEWRDPTHGPRSRLPAQPSRESIRPMTDSLPLEQKRACLETLKATRLREVIAAVGESTKARAKVELVDALARADVAFGEVLDKLTMAELRPIAQVVAVASPSRTKHELIEQILAAASPGESPASASSSRSPSSPPNAANAANATRDAGTLKSALRRFVLAAAGGYRGRDAELKFTLGLLTAFGWADGKPEGAAIPAEVAIVEHGERATRKLAALWNERRALVEVTKHDVMLDFAWKQVLGVCLQLDPVPQYVVLTNQRDLHLYDLARDKQAPRLAIAVDDLPKYSEAFPFLSTHWVPGATPKIINVGKVSREVADLVAKVYRSLIANHPKRQKEVIQFILQCIIAMFAEDIGLLPQEHFTSLLYEGAKKRDVETRLRELFRLMSTRDVPARVVAYFNGGLFKEPVTFALNDAELSALTKAAEANWRYVDPHIFGSVFQGIMNDAERHASGAHYTAHDDIMRVVGPTIVEPWRKRIREAKTLAELLDVRADLFKFRVLDPACGSGNFLYVAFRELYRLDTELLARLREFPSTQGVSKNRLAWSLGIQTSNFYGIDINPFAVELAKVTLNIAKKIAFDERKETAAEASAQVEMEVDPSLPLDNLDANIVCKDALFSEWPEVDAIVGNPPFLGGQKIRRELGAEYIQRLQASAGIDGVVDLACYWFRRAHDRLAPGARAGLVGTSGIRVGKAREAALDYVVARGGMITNAVSSRLWPGEAALNVSMVNWRKGDAEGPYTLIVDDKVYSLSRIPSHLQLHSDVSEASVLASNGSRTTMGVIFGHEAFRSESVGFPEFEHWSEASIRPVATGDDMLRGRMEIQPDRCIYLGGCASEAEARTHGPAAYAHLKKQIHPWLKERAATGTNDYATWFRKWWKPQKSRESFFAECTTLARLITCSNPAARPIFTFISSKFVPTNTLQVFAFDDDYSFGVIQSTYHWRWTVAKGGKVTERIRYTNDVWSTFPWPQDPTEASVARVAAAAQNLRAVRHELMEANGWSLRALHQAAEVQGAHPLKDAQQALDEAVAEAYGMPADQDALEFLLELNRCVAEDEAQGVKVIGPGLPPGFDAADPRWSSTDCIEPPPLVK